MTVIPTNDLLDRPIRLLRWWLAELAELWSLLPFKPGARRQYCNVHLETGCVIVDRTRGNQVERFVEHRPFANLGSESRAELQTLTEGSVVTVLLASPDIHTTSITLPPIAPARLKNAIDLQMAMIAPLRPELLSWSMTAVRRSAHQLHVDVAMAKRSTLDDIRAGLDEIASVPWAMAPAHAPDHPFVDYEGARRTFAEWSRNMRWTGASLLALASIPFTVIAAGALLTAQADRHADEFRENATEARSIVRMAAALEERRRAIMPLFGQPDAATLLNDLSERLPPSDWLRSIERRPSGALTFVVSTADEAVLDAALRQSDLLPGVHVSDQTPAADGRSDITYETDAP